MSPTASSRYGRSGPSARVCSRNSRTRFPSWTAFPPIRTTHSPFQGKGRRNRRRCGVVLSLWVPFQIDPSDFADFEGTASFRLLGRLADGTSPDVATTRFNEVAGRLTAD